MTIFGRIVTGTHVERAVIATLKLWMPTYLHEIERQVERDHDSLPAPRSYQTANEFVRWPEEQLPAVIIVAPGTIDEPRALSGGYIARWQVGVGFVVKGPDRGAVRELASLYTAAARAALVQHPSLGGFARGTDWLNEQYDPLPSDGQRTLGAGQAVLRVEVGEVVNPADGPITPEPTDPHEDPPTEWPTVEEVVIEYQKENP